MAEVQANHMELIILPSFRYIHRLAKECCSVASLLKLAVTILVIGKDQRETGRVSSG